jgi:hypothetical protein
VDRRATNCDVRTLQRQVAWLLDQVRHQPAPAAYPAWGQSAYPYAPHPYAAAYSSQGGYPERPAPTSGPRFEELGPAGGLPPLPEGAQPGSPGMASDAPRRTSGASS